MKEAFYSFVKDRANSAAMIYTGGHRPWQGIPFDDGSVNHSVSENVRNQAQARGLEASWHPVRFKYLERRRGC